MPHEIIISQHASHHWDLLCLRHNLYLLYSVHTAKSLNINVHNKQTGMLQVTKKITRKRNNRNKYACENIAKALHGMHHYGSRLWHDIKACQYSHGKVDLAYRQMSMFLFCKNDEINRQPRRWHTFVLWSWIEFKEQKAQCNLLEKEKDITFKQAHLAENNCLAVSVVFVSIHDTWYLSNSRLYFMLFKFCLYFKTTLHVDTESVLKSTNSITHITHSWHLTDNACLNSHGMKYTLRPRAARHIRHSCVTLKACYVEVEAAYSRAPFCLKKCHKNTRQLFAFLMSSHAEVKQECWGIVPFLKISQWAGIYHPSLMHQLWLLSTVSSLYFVEGKEDLMCKSGVKIMI